MSRMRKGKDGYACISVLLIGTLITTIVSSFLIQTLSMARLTQDFDQLRQRVNLVESLRNIITASAYDALEPKLLGGTDFRQELERQLNAVYPDAKIESAPNFSQIAFYPRPLNLGPIDAPVVLSLNSEKYSFQLKATAFPLINYNVVAYGLPITGATPETIPPELSSIANLKEGRVLCLAEENTFTAGNPLGDLSFLHRQRVGICWNLYEYIFSPEYQKQLIDKTGQYAIDLTQTYEDETLPAGLTFDYANKTLTVDLAKIDSEALAIIDPLGWGHVTLSDSGGNDRPLTLTLWSRNPSKQPDIQFAQSNTRPLILYCPQGRVVAGGHQLCGAFFLGKGAQWDGPATIKGHLSFYAPAPPEIKNLQVITDPTGRWMAACSNFVPQACEVTVQLQ